MALGDGLDQATHPRAQIVELTHKSSTRWRKTPQDFKNLSALFEYVNAAGVATDGLQCPSAFDNCLP